jgi:copper/silver efflux system protein
MVGGMITAPLLSMFVIPAAYLLLRRRRSAAPRRWFASKPQQAL